MRVAIVRRAKTFKISIQKRSQKNWCKKLSKEIKSDNYDFFAKMYLNQKQ